MGSQIKLTMMIAYVLLILQGAIYLASSQSFPTNFELTENITNINLNNVTFNAGKQPQNPFGGPPRIPGQPQNPFGGPPRIPGQNPFGGPQQIPGQPQNPFGGPQQIPGQSQNPFGGPQRIPGQANPNSGLRGFEGFEEGANDEDMDQHQVNPNPGGFEGFEGFEESTNDKDMDQHQEFDEQIISREEKE